MTDTAGRPVGCVCVDGSCAFCVKAVGGQWPPLRPRPNRREQQALAMQRQVSVPRRASSGPGTNVEAITKSLGIPSCRMCHEFAMEMDRWGVEGCRQRFDQIVARLNQQKAKMSWAKWLQAGVKAASTGLALRINWADPIPDVVRIAIEQAEEDRKKALAAGGPFPRRLDQANLCPGTPGLRFNPSLIEWRDGYLFAYRSGWAGSDIYLVHMDLGFNPVGDAIRLDLTHSKAAYGREDCRLFYHDGKLHVTFTGVIGAGRGRIRHTNVLYARIGDDLRVEKVYYPHYARRNSWEKNWGFFSHGGQLYAVYAIAPHKVLKIDGDHAELAHETATAVPWPGGEMRHGAAPVLVDGEWWCFFHDRVELPDRRRVYRAGLYTFEDRPPFRVKRIIPEPILSARLTDKPRDQYAYVVWPGGAVLGDGVWTLACGIHDRWTELYQFSHADLESRFIQIGPPSWWSEPDDGEAPGIFSWTVGKDEYRMAGMGLKGKAVVDVGAYIGDTAYAAVKHGAASVHCYEPEPEHVEHLRRNAERMPGVVVHAGAVPGTTTLDQTIERVGGRVGLLKMDCEGCEGPALEGATRLDLVDAVALEYHPPIPPERLKSILEGFGFVVEYAAGPDDPGRGLMFARRP